LDDNYITSSQLADLIRQNKTEGRTLCYKRYACILYGIISSIVADSRDAGKVLEQTFGHVFAKIDLYDANCGSFLTWAMQIARNVSITYLRSEKQIRQHSTAVQTSTDKAELTPSLTPAIEASEHEVLTMVLQGCLAHEVAAQCNMSVDAVKLKIRKAMLLKANRVSY
jgi:DNA-directed RNA polymerase specialized sigma24 family protein